MPPPTAVSCREVEGPAISPQPCPPASPTPLGEVGAGGNSPPAQHQASHPPAAQCFSPTPSSATSLGWGENTPLAWLLPPHQESAHSRDFSPYPLPSKPGCESPSPASSQRWGPAGWGKTHLPAFPSPHPHLSERLADGEGAEKPVSLDGKGRRKHPS